MDRYNILRDTIESLQTNTGVRTKEWFYIHSTYLQDYLDAFEDFEKIHPEFDSDEFRGYCRDLNILLNKLLMEYRTHQWFGLYDYLQFNILLLKTVDYAFNSIECDSDLTSLMHGLSV